MRRGGRRLVREDERVVYYDLDTDAHRRELLLSPDVSAPAQSRAATKAGDQIFPRQQQQLFNLDDSEGEEEGNPFATLLQQQAQNAQAAEEAATVEKDNSFLLATNATETRQPVANHRSILKPSEPRATARAAKKKLGFEAAGSRPDRWSTRKPSALDTKNRRKSLGAIQKRRSQLEASAAKRRKSMPPSPIDDSLDSTSKRRLLVDVLQRATTLSQQQHEEASVSQALPDENPTDGDAILDTEHQMRAEPFTPHIFSPSKPSTSTANGRKPKSDAISKIRGNMGDVIRKAIRKRNRDLTLLRSHGQHLLPQQNSHSSTGTTGAVESIQDRPCVVVCLKRLCAVTPHSVSYECQIHEVTAQLEESVASVLKDKHTMVVEVLFQPQAVEYLKLSSGKLLKIYQPFHFVEEKVATGSTSKIKWFLLSTQLTEVDQGSHDCRNRLDQCARTS